MSIVVASSLSPSPGEAIEVAGALCARLGLQLKLVHARPGVDAGSHEWADLAERARERHGIVVDSLVIDADAAETVLEVASAAEARWIVVPVSGTSDAERNRVLRASPVPVILVRDAGPLLAWAAGERPLRVMVAAELGPSSRAAAAFAASLREVAACDVEIAHVAWPPEEQSRLGVRGPMPLDRLRPEVAEPLERDLRAWIGAIPGAGETTFAVLPGWGRVDAHVAHHASEWKADLVVVGARRRRGAARLWHGSVSTWIARHAVANVALAPLGPEQITADPPTTRSVVIATDFSALAARAIPFGYGLLSHGGEVVLVHVTDGRKGRAELESQLRALIPPGASSRGITTEVVIADEPEVSVAICHVAAQRGADAICMATHGRSGIVTVLLGSQAQRVVRESHLPVLLVPPARHD